MNGREFVMILIFGGMLVAGVVLLAAWRKRVMDASTRRFELLAEALRDPQLDPGTRAELLRALARGERGVLGWIWQRLQNPMLWRVLWFGSGWLTMLLSGAALGMHAVGLLLLRSQEVPPVVMAAVLGFGMVTMPLALRELLRRDRVAAERR